MYIFNLTFFKDTVINVKKLKLYIYFTCTKNNRNSSASEWIFVQLFSDVVFTLVRIFKCKIEFVGRYEIMHCFYHILLTCAYYWCVWKAVSSWNLLFMSLLRLWRKLILFSTVTKFYLQGYSLLRLVTALNNCLALFSKTV